ncbi:sensor histidine kinase [Nocardia sp. CA-107356]|uniref:sensor histidine kinase n=1 Tax=Nocardia sp. CA-107356 TaxID=3239972 RepID=UPI003D923D07
MHKVNRAIWFRPSVRFRVLAIALIPSLSLLLVGGGMAGYLLNKANDIRSWSTAATQTAGPALNFVEAVQQERRTSMLVLAGDESAAAGLAAERGRLDGAIPPMMVAGDALIKLFEGSVGDAVVQMQATFGQLPLIRQRVDLKAAQVDEVYDYYNKVIQTVIVAGRLAARTSKVPEAANEQDTQVGLFESAEAMSRSSALAAAAAIQGGFAPSQQVEYSKLVGFYRAELDNRAVQLPPEEMAAYQALVSSPAWLRMGTLEDGLLRRAITTEIPSAPGAASAPGVASAPGTSFGSGDSTASRTSSPTANSAGQGNASSTGNSSNGSTNQVGTSANGAGPASTPPMPPFAGWKDAAEEVSSVLRGLWNSHLRYAGGVAEREGDRLSRQSIQGGVAVLGLSLIAFIAAAWLSQRLIGRLRRLRAETLAVSETRLPKIMAQIGRAEPLDLDRELPKLDFGRDEIGQVADAFNQAQMAATTAAVNEAQTRQGVRSVFVNIAHRSQVTMHQLLSLLETAEHRHDDPDTLKMLFEFDNLATRERRNAENLVILGGEQPGRQWRNPVPLRDLVRSAVTETEHYPRLHVVRLPDVAIAGAAVADLIHLISELIDNAATFSPPKTRVEISAALGGSGVIVEISDLGVGLTRNEIAQINEMLTNPPDFNVAALSSDPRLGLFVVAQLAKRHDVVVRLNESDYGGIRSVVRLPYELVAEDAPVVPAPQAEADDETVEEDAGDLMHRSRKVIRQPSPAESEDGDEAISQAEFDADPLDDDLGEVRRWSDRLNREHKPVEMDTPGKPPEVLMSSGAQPVAHVDAFSSRTLDETQRVHSDDVELEHIPCDDGPPLPQRRRQTHLIPQLSEPPAPMPDDHPSARIQRDRPSGQGRPVDLWTALQAGTKLGRSGVPAGTHREDLDR